MAIKQEFQNPKNLEMDVDGVVIDDPKKCEEILSQLSKSPDLSIVSKQPPKLPENAEDIWFKRR